MLTQFRKKSFWAPGGEHCASHAADHHARLPHVGPAAHAGDPIRNAIAERRSVVLLFLRCIIDNYRVPWKSCRLGSVPTARSLLARTVARPCLINLEGKKNADPIDGSKYTCCQCLTVRENRSTLKASRTTK